MTRYSVNNLGEESTIEIRHEFPVPKKYVELPDTLPPVVSVDVTEPEPRKTVVTLSFPADSGIGLEIQDAVDYRRPDE